MDYHQANAKGVEQDLYPCLRGATLSKKRVLFKASFIGVFTTCPRLLRPCQFWTTSLELDRRTFAVANLKVTALGATCFLCTTCGVAESHETAAAPVEPIVTPPRPPEKSGVRLADIEVSSCQGILRTDTNTRRTSQQV
eukprot:4964680-Amphidinium_carterae.1